MKIEITSSADQKQIEKNIWCVWDKGIYLTDKTTMIYYYKGTSQALSKYRNAFKNIFTDELKDGETLYTDTIKQCEIG